MTTKPSRSRRAIRRSATIDAINSADCAFAKRPSLVSAMAMHARRSSGRAGVRSSSGSGIRADDSGAGERNKNMVPNASRQVGSGEKYRSSGMN